MALGSGAASVRACVAGRGATTAAGIAWVGGDAAVIEVWSLPWTAVGVAALAAMLGVAEDSGAGTAALFSATGVAGTLAPGAAMGAGTLSVRACAAG
jgi:hypothetical protein